MTPSFHATSTLLVVLIYYSANALDNGLGLKPPMGYNTWYDTQCSLTEDTVRETAKALKQLGLDKLGYEYINLDDCWAKGRYSNGSIYAETPRFSSPSLKPLADYIHSLGLKFGVYTDRGTETCAGRPGSLGFEDKDADSYALWGVDYLKEDSCHATGDEETAFKNYATMRDALNATERQIFFSLCGWNEWYSPVGSSLGNSWRIGNHDFLRKRLNDSKFAVFSPDDSNWNGVLTNIDINAKLSGNAGPGGWNDPCLLLAEDLSGKQRMTELQTKAQFSMWSVMKSPLLISANLRNMTQNNLDTFSNAEVIGVNQDDLGHQGIRIFGGDLTGHYHNQDTNGINIWSTNLVDGAKAMVFLNVKDEVQNISCDAQCFEAAGFPENGVDVKVIDLWNKNRNLGAISTRETFTIENVAGSGGVEMYKMIPQFASLQT